MEISYNLKRLLSYLYPIIIQRFDSKISGTIELTLVNDSLVVDTANANYSYGSLHKIFKKAIKVLQLKEGQASNALILGFGAGSIARILNKENKLDWLIDGVDVDPVMLEIYSKYFSFPEASCTLHLREVIDYLKTCTKQYDYIFIDVFLNLDVPSNILTKQFLNLLLECSKSNTQIVMNTMLEKKHPFVRLWQETFKDKSVLKNYDLANLVLFKL